MNTPKYAYLVFVAVNILIKSPFKNDPLMRNKDHTKLIFVIVIIAKKTPWRIFCIANKFNRRM